MKILLIVYDQGSYINQFPFGIAYIAAALEQAGYMPVIYAQDINRQIPDHLTQTIQSGDFDAVAVGMCAGYYQYKKLVEIAGAVNKAKNRPLFILGGHIVTPDPEYFKRITGADIICQGEAEQTMVELARSGFDKNTIGIAPNERRKPIKEVDSIPFPAWHLFDLNYYTMIRYYTANTTDRMMPVLSGRGCPFNCNFCYRIEQGFRPRSNESILQEIEKLVSWYRVTYIDFADDLLMSSEQRTVSFCKQLIKSKLPIRWGCSGRLNFAKPDVMRLMRAANCEFVNFGIESLDNQTLRTMNKGLTLSQIIQGVQATQDAGIKTGLNIIYGNIGEPIEAVKTAVKFLLQHSDTTQLRTIRPVTPYPGTRLFELAVERGMIKDVADFYEHKHLNSDLLTCNFTNHSDEEVYNALESANLQLVDNYYSNRLGEAKQQIIKLYRDKDITFKGFRQT